MSLDLGRSKGYIQSISSGRAMPSMAEFFSICDYFGITPMQFFDEGMETPSLVNEIYTGVKILSEQDKQIMLIVMNRMLENKND